MGETAHFKWPWPVEGAEADPPLDLEKLAKAIEAVVHLLPVTELRTAGAGDQNKFLVVQGTGEAAWKLMKGDATFAADGTLSIGEEKVTEAMIKALAIGAAKLAVGSVITTKLAEEAVTALKVAKLAIETKHLANEAVTEPKLANGAVGPNKLAVNSKNLFPQLSGVSGSKIARGNGNINCYAASHSGNGTPFYHGLGVVPASVQVSPVIANNYVVAFDLHIFEVSSTYFYCQAIGSPPADVVFQINWLVMS